MSEKEILVNDTKAYTSYVMNKIREVCKKCGPRPAGSEADTKAQSFYVKHTKEVCDETAKEEFKCSDKAFMSWVALGAFLVLSSLVFFCFRYADYIPRFNLACRFYNSR